MAELKPCPFCGGKVGLVLCDDEGNMHDEAYDLCLREENDERSK